MPFCSFVFPKAARVFLPFRRITHPVSTWPWLPNLYLCVCSYVGLRSSDPCLSEERGKRDGSLERRPHWRSLRSHVQRGAAFGSPPVPMVPTGGI